MDDSWKRGGHASPSPRRGGFVLLMSLILIAMAGIILVELARQSLSIAEETAEARSDLQCRWGRIFLSRVLLSDPEKLVARHLGAETAPADIAGQAWISTTVPLGNVPFLIILDDESRKLNINRLRMVAGTRKVLETIRRFGGGSRRIELRPVGGGVLGVRQFDSWGHVLVLPATHDARLQFDQIRTISPALTCWGGGRVNVHRCSDDVLQCIGALAAGPITANRLVALREDNMGMTADQLLAKLPINRRKAALLKGWLTDRSDCYSLCIFVDAERALLDLYVQERGGTDSHRTKHFRW